MATPKIGNQNSITPDPGEAQTLLDKAGASFAAVLPASAAYLYSEAFNIASARFLTLQVFYTAHASSTTGQPSIQVRVSNELAVPAYDAATSWSELSVRDDALGTPAAIAASGLASAWETVGPTRNILTSRAAIFRPAPIVANSDKLDWAGVFDVTGWRWCQVRIAETGDTTNRGTVTALKASLTA